MSAFRRCLSSSATRAVLPASKCLTHQYVHTNVARCASQSQAQCTNAPPSAVPPRDPGSDYPGAGGSCTTCHTRRWFDALVREYQALAASCYALRSLLRTRTASTTSSLRREAIMQRCFKVRWSLVRASCEACQLDLIVGWLWWCQVRMYMILAIPRACSPALRLSPQPNMLYATSGQTCYARERERELALLP